MTITHQCPECARLTADRDELKADANRWRGLRNIAMRLSLPNDTVATLVRDVTELDAAIAGEKK
jgi:hypothetical protein